MGATEILAYTRPVGERALPTLLGIPVRLKMDGLPRGGVGEIASGVLPTCGTGDYAWRDNRRVGRTPLVVAM